MKLPVAILAGGLATRMKPYTEQIPKSLLDVHGKPFAVRQLDCLAERGVRRVVLCVGHRGQMIRQVIGDGGQFGVQVQYSDEGAELLGTGGALKKALPLLGAAFLVVYGDSLLECDYQAAARSFLESGKKGLMTVYRNDGRYDTSNVLFADGRIRLYDKVHRVPEMSHIDYGLGALSSRAFENVAEGARVDLALIYQNLLAEDELAGLEVFERFYEIGSPAGLADTRRYFEAKESGT
ncbi:MAG: sugar phosphate nucleotidyltransferase [Spirochaetia bacterium]